MTNLHERLPVSKSILGRILTDIRKLYPETDSISIVGTYARLNEKPTDKKHDVDILIHFPEKTNRKLIENRNDDALWGKWSNHRSNPPVDFLFMFGSEESKYGQHQWRLHNNLNTPKILVWKK